MSPAPLVAGRAACPGELRAGHYFFPSVFTHDKNNKSWNVSCIINACSFSLQIYVSIMTQIKRLSLHQNVNERDTPHFQRPIALKAGPFSPRAFDFEGETSAACDESDDDNGRK